MPGQSPGRSRTTNKASCHHIDAKRREAGSRITRFTPAPAAFALYKGCIISRFGHQLGLHKPSSLFHPEVRFLAVDHTDIPIPHTAHLGGAAADVLDLVDLVHLLRAKADRQRPQVAVRLKADIHFHIPLFASDDLARHVARTSLFTLSRVEKSHWVHCVVILWVDGPQPAVGIDSRPLDAGVPVPLAHHIHRLIQPFEFFALFGIAEKAKLNGYIGRYQRGPAHADTAQRLAPAVVAF